MLKCSKCKNNTFYIEVTVQVNGNDDTYDIICSKCGHIECGESSEVDYEAVSNFCKLKCGNSENDCVEYCDEFIEKFPDFDH
jgi:hypothetical protein